MYVLRSEANHRIINDEKAQYLVLFERAKAQGQAIKLPPPGTWSNARPGDVLVDRGLRAVYLILPTGQRVRCRDEEAKKAAIDKVKDQLESLKKLDEIRRRHEANAPVDSGK